MRFPIRPLPDNTKFRFMRLRNIVFAVSGFLSILSVVAFVAIGPNYGIDFTGGTLIEIKTLDGPPDIGVIRDRIGGLNLGDVQIQEIQEFGQEESSVLIRVGVQEGGEAAQQATVESIRTAFGDTIEIRRVEIVGPRVSGELARNGIIATVVTLIAIMIYVWFRFEWQFSIGAIIATIHDVLLTLGFFVVTQLDFSLSSIAAVLTIVGYSLNDTVVVYDRIREILRKFKKVSLGELIDRAINETLARTTITGMTTLLALTSLFIFGGEVIRSFVAAMIFGIVIGTYSSIFIAAPVLILFGLRSERMQAPEKPGAKPPPNERPAGDLIPR